MSILTPPLKNLKDTRWTSNNMCKTSERNCRKFCNKISRLIDQRSNVSLLEKILNVVSRMFREHSLVRASFSPRTSFNAKALISLSQLCTRQRNIFPWNPLTDSQQYQCQLKQGIYEWKLDFNPWLMLRIKHVHMDLIQNKDQKLSILC